MNPRTATWWGRAEHALRLFFKRLTKLARGHVRREEVRVRVRRRRREIQSVTSHGSSWALLLLFAMGCGGPNDSEPDDSEPDVTEPDVSDPEVLSISPTSGPAAGGTPVTIIGVDFDPLESTEVLFGSNFATGVTVCSDTSIMCNSPAGLAGTSVDVLVITTTGTLSSPMQFAYEAPTNAELEITWRSQLGVITTGVLTVELHAETPITSENFRDLAEQGLFDDTLFHRISFRQKIEGGDFENADGSGGHAAEFHGIGDEFDPSTWRIPDEASTSPDHEDGSLAMHLPEGSDSAGSTFYIACPDSEHSSLDGVNTVFAQSVGGSIDGVDVGFEALLEELHRIATGIGYAPNHPVRLVEVRLTDGFISAPGGGEGGDEPTISLLDPSFGPPEGNHQIVIAGSGFGVDPTCPPLVTFGGAPVEGTIVLDDGTMLCTVPAGSPSTRVDVEVITAAGVVVAEDAFQYLAGPVVVLHISWTDNDAVAHTGLIAVELFEDNAPTHVDNFLQLAEGSFYDQVPFHRVIDGFMIQGGDFENGNGTGGHAAQYYGFGDPGDESTWTVPDEADNGLTHVPGVLSMAKTGLPNSGGSQFFFVDRDSFPSHLDGVHTVFGRAAVGVMDSLEVTGLDVVDELSQVATDFNDRPLLPVTIESAIRIGGSSSAFLAGPGGGLAGEAHAWDALYTPWNSGALLAALSAAEGAGAGRWSGTRGVFRGEASAGDRLMVWVRSLERGAVPCAPIAIGDRAGWLSLVAGASDGAIDERCYEVEIEADDRVMVFVPRDPIQWVRARIVPPQTEEE